MWHWTGKNQFTTYISCQNDLQVAYHKDSTHNMTLKEYNKIIYNISLLTTAEMYDSHNPYAISIP